LKPCVCEVLSVLSCRSPHGGRGLKLTFFEYVGVAYLVAPHTGGVD